MNLDTTWGF